MQILSANKDEQLTFVPYQNAQCDVAMYKSVNVTDHDAFY